MTIITATCVILCVFIFCLFTFFTIVYLSELKREKELRRLMIEEANKSHASNNLPILVMDLPIKPKAEAVPTTSKPKKNIN